MTPSKLILQGGHDASQQLMCAHCFKHTCHYYTKPTEQQGVILLLSGQALKLTAANIMKKLYIQDSIKGCDSDLMWQSGTER